MNFDMNFDSGPPADEHQAGALTLPCSVERSGGDFR
jgi:hypothetical protein